MSTTVLERRRKTLGLIYLLPSLLLLSVFLFYPIVNSVVMSFTNWSGFTEMFDFVGLENYRKVIFDKPEFWDAIVVNLKYSLITAFLQTILGFLAAFMLFNMTKGFQKFFKVTLYMPVILPTAVIGVMWTVILSPDFGMLNSFLRIIGLDSLTRAWTGDPDTALGTVIAVTLWRWVGFAMVIYYVAMLNISKEVLESARVEGASRFQQMKYFFLPLSRGATEINFILAMIGGMKAFDMFYMLTGGGPGTATQVTAHLVYRTAFQSFKFSRALAMAVISFALVLLMTYIGRMILGEKDDRR